MHAETHWARAEASKPDHAPKNDGGTVAATVRALRASKRWKALAQSTRTALRFHLERIETAHGTLPVKGLRQQHVEADLSKLDPNPANASLKVWRHIFAQAKADRLIVSDPSHEIRKKAVKGDGHAPWSHAEVARFRQRWPAGTPQRAAFEVLAWTGCRVSDACRLTRGMVEGGVLTFRQQKTGGMAHVPWTAALPSWAAGWEVERQMALSAIEACAGELLLIQTMYRKARTVKGLSNYISDAAEAAKVEGRTAHGLRKYRLSAIAESGGSAHAIMAWGGHASLSEAEAYTRAASRRALVVARENPVAADQNKNGTL